MENLIQGSPEWFAARLGKVTASRINDVMATLKSGGEAAGRKNYRAQLVVERLTGQVAETYTNGAMQWGTDHEPDAREAYEFWAGVSVERAGFIDHPTIEGTGASPDGLIGCDGMIEIKCPNTATHIEWMLAGKVPPEHINQMTWQMECCNRKWCDFVSYDPRMPIDLQLFVAPRLTADEERTGPIRAAVQQFLTEVECTINRLRGLGWGGR